MPEISDQTGRVIHLPAFPKRIVSLVPSQTELLASLGLEEEVVGITKFCIHPARWFRNKTKVGGTKEFHFDIVHRLEPDLIIANKEENRKTDIEQLEKAYPVWVSDIHTLQEVRYMISQIGILTGTEQQAGLLVKKIEEAFDRIPPVNSKKRVAYLIWKQPYMIAGGDTFIHHMLDKAGYENVFKNQLRYPQVSLEQILEARPEIIFLSSEPYPFREKDKKPFGETMPGTKVFLVNGELFSWYGSRLIEAAAYFVQLRTVVDQSFC